MDPVELRVHHLMPVIDPALQGLFSLAVDPGPSSSGLAS